MIIRFTRITSANGPLTKRIYLDENGHLQKIAAAQLYRGQYQVDSITNLADFSAMLEAATPDTAFTYGVPDLPAGIIVREDDLSLNPSAIARTRRFFAWPKGPGILMIDDDSGKQNGDFADFLRASVPFLADIEILVRPSSSSWIMNNETGQWVRQEVNRRAYVIVSDAVAIPEVGKLIESYLWLAGHGYYDVSIAGRLLKRCAADTSVWQPERLDFIGGAICVAPLSQPVLRAKFSSAKKPWIDAKQLPIISQTELATIQRQERQARALVDQTRKDKLQVYIDDRTNQLVTRGVTPEAARTTVQAAIDGLTLSGDFMLKLQSGAEITVGEMLKDPKKFHGGRCHDPLEPNYRDDPRIAYISLINGTEPYVYSHAHGGCKYKLKKQKKDILLTPGESARNADEIARYLADEEVIFDRGQLLVTVRRDGKTRVVSTADIKYSAASHCNLQRFDSRSKGLRAADLPDSVAQLLLTFAGLGAFSRLNGVITAPTITAEGRLISAPGFDRETGLFLITNGENGRPAINSQPNHSVLHEAFEQLWFPFKDFPFDGDDSRSAMVAALLSAVVRPCLSTSPGFGFDAPTAGSGKTKLAQCVAALATGSTEALLPPPSDDEETRKKLSTAVLSSKQVVIFDNIEALLKSPNLAAFLTAPSWSDRILGGNTQIEAENRVLVLFTGNNLAPVGDITRRLIIVRIDPKIEASDVWKREFNLEPLGYVISNRQRMVVAALTLLSGYVTAGMPRSVPGRLGSFEQWDGLVRQCVIWIGTQGIGNLVDPVKRLNDTAALDPEVTRLATLARAWFSQYGDSPQQLKDVVLCGRLNEHLREVALDRRGMLNPKILAGYLSKRTGKIVDGLGFERVKGRSNTAQWRIFTMADSTDGFGGFGGLVSPHLPNNINSYADIFDGVAEPKQPKPPNPPPNCAEPELSSAGGAHEDEHSTA
jgi:hypothetical protein